MRNEAKTCGGLIVSNYEEKLSEFSQGKRLQRLPHPVRDRADAYCDACGSSLPRTLYAIKDLESDRYFFVGETCLKELANRGAVLRSYGRESGQKSYESEMLMRAQEPKKEKASLKAEDAGTPAPLSYGLVLDHRWRSCSSTNCVSRPSRSRPTRASSL